MTDDIKLIDENGIRKDGRKADALRPISMQVGVLKREDREIIERVKENPQQSFFTAEQLQDFLNDSVSNHTPIKETFGITFQRVGDYLKKAVPEVKAAMAKQQK